MNKRQRKKAAKKQMVIEELAEAMRPMFNEILDQIVLRHMIEDRLGRPIADHEPILVDAMARMKEWRLSNPIVEEVGVVAA